MFAFEGLSDRQAYGKEVTSAMIIFFSQPERFKISF
jgi:hypothetical protein